MAGEPLPEMLEELVSRVRSLESEKKQAVNTIMRLERKVAELEALIASASEKVEGMLNDSPTPYASQSTPVKPPAESRDLQSPAKPAPFKPRDLNRRFPLVCDPTE